MKTRDKLWKKNRKRLLIFLFQMDKNAYGYISIVSVFALIYRLSNYILIIFWSLNRNNYRRSTKFKRSGDFFTVGRQKEFVSATTNFLFSYVVYGFLSKSKNRMFYYYSHTFYNNIQVNSNFVQSISNLHMKLFFYNKGHFPIHAYHSDFVI